MSKSNSETPQESNPKTSAVTHQTNFHGAATGPIHTGSGAIHVGNVSSAVAHALTPQQDLLVSHYSAPFLAGLRQIVGGLSPEELKDVLGVMSGIDSVRLPVRDFSKFLGIVEASVASTARAHLLPEKAADRELTVNEIIAAPEMGVTHKIKIILPIIPFLLRYEGEFGVGSKLNLEHAWTWLKRQISGQ